MRRGGPNLKRKSTTFHKINVVTLPYASGNRFRKDDQYIEIQRLYRPNIKFSINMKDTFYDSTFRLPSDGVCLR